MRVIQSGTVIQFILVIHQMNISKIDLNLLIYFDVLLKECNVTKAADRLNITQPAMSNGLKRLRELLNDPILVRTSQGMQPTRRALHLKPIVRELIQTMEKALITDNEFDYAKSDRLFRIMVSDYAASTLLPPLLDEFRKQAPDVTLDIITPSDTTFHEIENGQVDLAINAFSTEPASFHQQVLWQDKFCVLMRMDNQKSAKKAPSITIEDYFQAKHVWVSKTGYGVSVGMTHEDVQKLRWVDGAINNLGKQRNISIFTRSYHVALQLAQEHNLIATIPYRAALLKKHHSELAILPVPFEVEPLELKMIWSPLLHQDAGHKWLRRLIKTTAKNIPDELS